MLSVWRGLESWLRVNTSVPGSPVIRTHLEDHQTYYNRASGIYFWNCRTLSWEPVRVHLVPPAHSRGGGWRKQRPRDLLQAVHLVSKRAREANLIPQPGALYVCLWTSTFFHSVAFLWASQFKGQLWLRSVPVVFLSPGIWHISGIRKIGL